MGISGPTIVRRQLGRRLRTAREHAGKSIEDVVSSGIVSRSTIFRYESGSVAISPGTVLELCLLYSIDQTTTRALYALAIGTQGRGWWDDYADSSKPFRFALYLGLESSAAAIDFFDPSLVPGLLQTEDYARAVTLASIPVLDNESVERILEIRLRRQQELINGRSPSVRVVLAQGALERVVGGPMVHAAQMDHLRRLVKGSQVGVRVLLASSGAHAALSGVFTLMRYGDVEDPTVVYAETLVGGSYFEETSQVERYAEVFDTIWAQSIPLEEYTP